MVPGFCLAASTRSLTLRIGSAPLATRISGVEPTKPIGAKSFTLS